MRKREFMDELKKALDGNVSTQTYYDTINYYEDYFKKQKEAGKSEEEICSSLGSASSTPPWYAFLYSDIYFVKG